MRTSDRERRLFDGLWGIARNSNSGWSSGFRWGGRCRTSESLNSSRSSRRSRNGLRSRKQDAAIVHTERARLADLCGSGGTSSDVFCGIVLGRGERSTSGAGSWDAWADGPHRARELGLGPSPSPSLHVSIERNPTAGGVVPHQRSDRAGNRRATIEWRPR